MSYRKLDVNGSPFKYTIGRTHVKIRGDGYSKAFAKSDIGQRLENTETYVVTPANIRNAILGKPGARVFICEQHGTATTTLASDPFDAEIYGKTRLVPSCRMCLVESAWAI